jgi:VWFA-related protein
MRPRLDFVASCAVLVLGFQLFGGAAAQTPMAQTEQKPGEKQEQKPEQKVTIGTSEVVVDVVVRDKKGRPVKDLAATDFDIDEDGVKQQIQSFHLYQRETGEAGAGQGGAPAGGAGAGAGNNPFAGVSVVALVFDRLSPEARELAHKAALSYVSGAFNQDDFAGVYLIDLSLRILQPITNNKELLSKAIDRAASFSTSTFASVAEQSSQISDQADYVAGEAASTTSTGGGGGRGGGSAPSNPQAGAEAIAARMNQNMLDQFESLQRDEQGYATINSLLAIIASLKTIEGRKALVFFSEGLAIPPAVAQRFPAVISAANRANVSVYGIDAAGLRVESPLASTVRQQSTVATRRRISNQSNEDTSGHPMTRDLERNEDVLRLNPDSGLTQLAEQTGGFLIKDTNNLKIGLAKIDEDMRFHYVMSYVPKNADYDGRFRQISVKLDRPGLEVQTRKGYYALPNIGGAPILDYEAPALAALANSKAKEDPAMRAAAYSFPADKKPSLVPVLVEVPGREFTYEVDKDKHTYKGDFCIVALLKDQSDQVAAKLSQHYQVSGPADKVEAAKKAEILFYRETQLPPGQYSLEVIAYDQPSGKSSLKTAAVEVPSADDSIMRLSSLALLQRAEKLSDADKKVDNPFHFGEVLVYPNMGRPLSKSLNKQVAFFFTVYPAKGGSTSPKLRLRVLKDGKELAAGSPALGPADSSGRIQYASALPLDGFQPGNYVLEIIVGDGRTSASRSMPFTVQP